MDPFAGACYGNSAVYVAAVEEHLDTGLENLGVELDALAHGVVKSWWEHASGPVDAAVADVERSAPVLLVK